MSYCVELRGSIFLTTNSIIVLRNQAIHIINKTDYYAHTNPLFLYSRVVKFSDLLYHKIMQIMFKTKSMLLPDSVQKFFSIWESKYELRGVCKFTVQKAKKGIKRRCISIIGVKLWNDANINLKMCNSLLVFKRMVCKAMFDGYECEYVFVVVFLSYLRVA